jgi:5-methylcytosine-specific restriction endonuclease McrA
MPIRPENRARYPRNWKQISHWIRFSRAEGRCEFMDGGTRCEAYHGEPHPVTGAIVVLTVAHLDHQPENCVDWNLKAACQRCHLRYDAELHANTRTRSRRARLASKDLFDAS